MDETKCVIFDCDGVLVDSEEIGNNVLLSMAKEFGLDMTIEEAMMSFGGRSLRDCFQQIENRINQKLPPDFEEKFREQSYQAFKTDLKPVVTTQVSP